MQQRSRGQISWQILRNFRIGQRMMVGLLVLEVLLVGCSPSPVVQPSQSALSPEVSTTSDAMGRVPGQSLPISAQVKVADQVIQLEVARTEDQQAMGLMHRASIEANRGMLFPFVPARQVGFWMKNVAMNLDMIFLYNGQVVAIASNVPPCQAEPCSIYGPNGLVDQVIELRGGRAGELKIKVGDQLTVQAL